MTGSAVSPTSVTLSWDDPQDASISGYVILRRDIVNQEPGIFNTIQANTGSAATTYTDSSAAPDTAYAYRVKARNANGVSGQSGFLNVTTPGAAPDAPRNLTDSALSSNIVTLSWDDPEDASISGYVILRRDIVNQEPGIFDTIQADTGSAATTYTDSSAAPDTAYAYRVKARNAHGVSGQSGFLNVTTPGAAPDAPRNLTDSALSSNSVTLSWDDPEDASISGYVILRRETSSQEPGTFDTIQADTGSAATTYTDSSAEPDIAYAYRVKARNANGDSAPSNDLNVTTPAQTTTEDGITEVPANEEPLTSAEQGTTTCGETSTEEIAGRVIEARLGVADLDRWCEFHTVNNNSGETFGFWFQVPTVARHSYRIELQYYLDYLDELWVQAENLSSPIVDFAHPWISSLHSPNGLSRNVPWHYDPENCGENDCFDAIDQPIHWRAGSMNATYEARNESGHMAFLIDSAGYGWYKTRVQYAENLGWLYRFKVTDLGLTDPTD